MIDALAVAAGIYGLGLLLGLVLRLAGAGDHCEVRDLLTFKGSRLWWFVVASVSIALVAVGVWRWLGLLDAPPVYPFSMARLLLGSILFGAAWGFLRICPGGFFSSFDLVSVDPKRYLAVLGGFLGAGIFHELVRQKLDDVFPLSPGGSLDSWLRVDSSLGAIAIGLAISAPFVSKVAREGWTRDNKLVTSLALTFGAMMIASAENDYHLGVSGAWGLGLRGPQEWRNLLFIGGFMSSGWLIRGLGSVANGQIRELSRARINSEVSPVALLFGGFCLMLGALLGAGCTTGATLAGVPTLSMNFLVATVVYFGSAVLTARLVERIKNEHA